ncbi:hypothetical protein ACFLTT_02920, partial [Chloroflexota bacterium]
MDLIIMHNKLLKPKDQRLIITYLIFDSITWVGLIVILGAGIFCCWSLLGYRTNYEVISNQFSLITIFAFSSLGVA